MNQVLLVQFGELSLKGKNRHLFEKKLVNNLKTALEGTATRTEKQYGRLYIEPSSGDQFEDQEDALSRVQRVFGIATILEGYRVDSQYDVIEKALLDNLDASSFESFAIRAHRSDKKFPMNSEEVNKQLGAAVVKAHSKKVNLSEPDLEVQVIIMDTGAVIALKKYGGAGGLPVSSSGKMISLLSSGIDSPVASHRMMGRGAQLIYLHFHSYPMTSDTAIENTKEIVKILQEHQPPAKLLLAPLAELQKKIVTDTPSSYRVILYRRAMYQIADRLAQKNKASALITGESLGQVASQTVENMTVTGSDLTRPIFRPLVGMDKQEIIDQAQEIGTFDISIRPYEDCCSLLLPEKVETRAQLSTVREIEASVAWDDMLQQVIDNIEEVSV